MSDNTKYKFSGHQTFVFRYGWLEKGVRGIKQRATLFSDDDALVQLGVGKNMVVSIRHWCVLSQLVEHDPDVEKNTGRYLRATELGEKLLLDEGWDPFLEDDASLWLLHWLIVSNDQIGTTWKLLFSRFFRPDFTKQELTDFIVSFAEKESLRVGENVIARDVDCVIRTYAAGTDGGKSFNPEESFGCPLLQLGLIQPSPDGELYRFAIGPKPSLPAEIFAFALSQYLDRIGKNVNTLNVQKCLYGEGSPGQAFKLDENSLIEYIEELEASTNGALMLDETSGLKQIYRRKSFDTSDVLDRYYACNGSLIRSQSA